MTLVMILVVYGLVLSLGQLVGLGMAGAPAPLRLLVTHRDRGVPDELRADAAPHALAGPVDLSAQGGDLIATGRHDLAH